MRRLGIRSPSTLLPAFLTESSTSSKAELTSRASVGRSGALRVYAWEAGPGARCRAALSAAQAAFSCAPEQADDCRVTGSKRSSHPKFTLEPGSQPSRKRRGFWRSSRKLRPAQALGRVPAGNLDKSHLQRGLAGSPMICDDGSPVRWTHVTSPKAAQYGPRAKVRRKHPDCFLLRVPQKGK